MLNRSGEEYEFRQKIITSDEAVNRENCRILATELPHLPRKKHYIRVKLMYGVEYGLMGLPYLVVIIEYPTNVIGKLKVDDASQ